MVGTYYGGSTIIGPGARWSDASDFPGERPVPSKKKRRRKKRRKVKATEQAISPRPAPEKALLNPRQLGLLSAVMSDLGRTLPRKVARVNVVVRELQAEGLVLPDGELNKKHPELLRWLEKMEKKVSE